MVREIYSITKQLPKSELFGLISQMQRAAVAIPSNIAEGFGRNHSKEFVQFLAIAFSSSLELETQIVIAKQEYGKIGCSKADPLLLEIQKMLKVLMSKVSGFKRTRY